MSYLIIALAYLRYAFVTVGRKEKLNMMQMLFQVLFLSNIHIWLYGSSKFYEGIKRLRSFFDAAAYKRICDAFRHWGYLWWMDSGKSFRNFIKVFYTFIWIAYCICIINVFVIHYHFIPINIYGFTTIVLYVLVMTLNYSSYYLCIAYVFFLRSISKIELEHNEQIPSSTWGFQRLLHDSSMVSIAFLVDSMIYVVIYFIEIYVMIGGKYFYDIALFKEKILLGYVTFFTLLPSLFSFFIVFILPKVFLDRLLKRWKLEELKRLDDELKNGPVLGDSSRDRKQLMIDHIIHDRIRFGRFEIGTAVLSLMVNLSAIIVNVIQIFK